MKTCLRSFLVLVSLLTFIIATWASPIAKRDSEAAMIKTPTTSYHRIIIERDVVDLHNTGGSKTSTTTATATSTTRPPKPIPTTAPSTNPGNSNIYL